jgi:hypothetical protein
VLKIRSVPAVIVSLVLMAYDNSGWLGATALPAVPSNPSPATGTPGVARTTTLSWTASAGAASYDVYFGTSANPPLRATVTASKYSVGPLNSRAKYYWKVIARNAVGTESSPTWSFVTSPADQLSCDLNSDGVVNVVDVRIAENQALGLEPCGSADLNQDGVCNVVDVQRVIDAVLGKGCRVGH